MVAASLVNNKPVSRSWVLYVGKIIFPNCPHCHLCWKNLLKSGLICRPGKIFISLQQFRFPSRVGWFPVCISLFFPPNHKISWQGASRFACFFQACRFVTLAPFKGVLHLLRKISMFCAVSQNRPNQQLFEK